MRFSAGKLSESAWARSSVASTMRHPRALRAEARAWAGKRWPPVPPAAITATFREAKPRSDKCAGLGVAVAGAVGAGAAAGQGHGHAQGQAHGQNGRAAVGNE